MKGSKQVVEELRRSWLEFGLVVQTQLQEEVSLYRPSPRMRGNETGRLGSTEFVSYRRGLSS